MALDDMTIVVSAVVALADGALVALDLLAESVLTARKDDTHDGRSCRLLVRREPMLPMFLGMW